MSIPMEFFYILVVIGIVIIIYFWFPDQIRNLFATKEEKNEKQKLLNEYEVAIRKNQKEIEKIKKEKYFKGSLDIPNENDKENFVLGFVYSFIKNNTLSFVEEAVQLDEPNKASTDVLKERTQEPLKINISLEDIKYYTINGEAKTIQEVTGTGGGSSLGGAILGGVIAGSTGAIIGSRKGIEIKTTNKEFDNRKLIIKTTDNKKYIFYNAELYELLFEIIPEKDYEIYKRSLEQNTNTSNLDNSTGQLEQLDKLSQLKEKGIITEQEFEESKKKILSKL